MRNRPIHTTLTLITDPRNEVEVRHDPYTKICNIITHNKWKVHTTNKQDCFKQLLNHVNVNVKDNGHITDRNLVT